jgi:tetratricopeptide (TPR) repeat protein
VLHLTSESTIGAFDLLCNMNLRDKNLAERESHLLDGSELAKRYPEAILGLGYWAQDQLDSSRQKFREHLDRCKQDYIALFVLHMIDFLHGRPDLYDQYLISDERGDHPNFGSYYKGMLAFSLCEMSQPEAALPLAQQACDKDPLDDIYSIHALIHCWHAIGDHGSVVTFLERNKHQWIENPGMNMHVHWHLAVSYLKLGKINNAVDSYWSFRDLIVSNHAEQDLDAVNFCCRMFFGRFPRPGFHLEFQTLAKNWAPSIYNSLSYFNDVHAAFAFMMSGESALMQKLLARPSLHGTDPETVRIGEEILQSIADFMDGDFFSCIKRLQETRPHWHRIGGSQAQREILDILCTAAEAMVPNTQTEQQFAIA